MKMTMMDTMLINNEMSEYINEFHFLVNFSIELIALVSQIILNDAFNQFLGVSFRNHLNMNQARIKPFSWLL